MVDEEPIFVDLNWSGGRGLFVVVVDRGRLAPGDRFTGSVDDEFPTLPCEVVEELESCADPTAQAFTYRVLAWPAVTT